MSEENKALLQRWVEEGFNKGNLGLFDELFADCVYYSPATGELKGEALKQFVASVRAAFPDGQMTIEDQVAEGDKVVTRWSFVGTHQGAMMGIAPTGKRVTMSGMVVDRIVEGKVVEEREEWDARGLMQQLGAAPESTEANKALARRWYEEGFNKRDMTLLNALFHPDFVLRGPLGGDVRGLETTRQYLKAVFTAFPDAQITVDDQVAEGDAVVTCFGFTGTHQGEFIGVAATGRQITIRGTTVLRVANGKITEGWDLPDLFGSLQQMGAAPQATGANKAVFRRLIEEGWNKHNLALLDELYADCVLYRPETGERKGEALKQFVASVLAAFPGIRFTIQDQVAEGDKLVTHWSCTGTHQGEFMGLAPTGKQITTSGISIDRIVEGKIVDERQEWDALGMMQQLGVVPPLGKGEEKAAA